MAAMALRQPLAATLGQELQGLEADAGPRLEKILWRLSVQARQVPGDLDTAVAYGHALALAGRDDEARAEALRLLTLVNNAGDTIPTWMLLNAAGALTDAGFPTHAMACVERALIHGARSVMTIEAAHSRAAGIALRYGALEWYAQHIPLTQHILESIHEQGLSSWWPAQQRAIESTLGEHVASTIFDIQDLKDGTRRINLDYFTDLQSHSEIGELQDVVLDAVSAVYTQHSEGSGAFLGKVLIDLHGAEIPLKELDP